LGENLTDHAESASMTPQEFIAKWKRANLAERSAAQQHFLDLCEMLNQPKPASADPDGAWYTFERGVNKVDGGKGWADVWMREHFGWEYKGKHKDLDAAYKQLLLYREDLENPPLLIVCDLDRFEVHTNFTNTPKKIYCFNLDELAEPVNLDILRKAFTNPEALKPQQTTQEITEEVATLFSRLADGMRARNVAAEAAAHFLMKLMFCMFAEDINLLPEKLFRKILAGSHNDPGGLSRRLQKLFEAMGKGGEFGADSIVYFDGGLFADADVIDLTRDEIEKLTRVNECDWSNVEPSIFGTLFERTLDPAKRSQIGAHYTSKEDILTLLEPVLMAPLRREWEEVKAKSDKLWSQVQESVRKKAGKATSRESKVRKNHDKLLEDFGHRLANVTVLDPACGSGNFLYVAINLLLDLEKLVISHSSQHGVSWFPLVRPTHLYGIEINPYAYQLAQIIIWIGYLQWMHHNGFKAPSNPVLQPIENIRHMDAILDLSEPDKPKEPEWPAAEFIVGNPPFLGDKKLRTELSDGYVANLFSLYSGSIPNGSDLCCYWFEKARRQIEAARCRRAGLLATQGIRGGLNRETLKRIKDSGDIFFAESDRDWILDGANVHISMIGFDDGSEGAKTLDGRRVLSINPNLSSTADITTVKQLNENLGLSYIGTTKKAPFDISDVLARRLLTAANPHGLPNSEVLFPYANGMYVTRRPSADWIIDFAERTISDAALFEGPFAEIRERVYPLRRHHREPRQREKWWLLARPCTEMREAVGLLPRFLVTPTVCKYRVFAWLSFPIEADHQLYVFARDNDFFFGIVHSRLHEVWGLKLGTRLETRPRYTPTTCFETFPFPAATDEQKAAIADAAKALDTLRTNWLNPPEWTHQEVLEFPGSVNGPWCRFVHDPDSCGIGTVRYPRIVPKDEERAKHLQKRTLTNLYNERPTWLDLAHKKLDAAVFAAYGWKPEMSDEESLAGLLALNLERAAR
jgi:type II restriction/modification system DNA methylase subunit YeeA